MFLFLQKDKHLNPFETGAKSKCFITYIKPSLSSDSNTSLYILHKGYNINILRSLIASVLSLSTKAMYSPRVLPLIKYWPMN